MIDGIKKQLVEATESNHRILDSLYCSQIVIFTNAVADAIIQKTKGISPSDAALIALSLPTIDFGMSFIEDDSLTEEVTKFAGSLVDCLIRIHDEIIGSEFYNPDLMKEIAKKFKI